MVGGRSETVCIVKYGGYLRDSRAQREAEALVGCGYGVDVICTRRPSEPVLQDSNGVRIFPILLTHYRGTNPLRYLWSYLRFLLAAAVKLGTLFGRRHYSVIQVFAPPDAALLMALPYKLFGTRLVMDLKDHTPELFASRFDVGRSSLVFRSLVVVERLCARLADRILVVHDRQKELLAARGIPWWKMTTVLNAADERIFDPALYSPGDTETAAEDRFVLLYLGTILQRQGLDILVQAAARVAPDLPSLRVHILGRGDFRSRVCDLITELGLEDVVRVGDEEGVPYHEVPEHLQSADACVIPVRQDLFTDDILPVKLLEAVAMKRPVIASRTTTMMRHFDDRAICYVTPGNVDELADAIRRLAKDRALRERLVREASRQAAPYTWQAAKARYCAVVDAVARRPPRHASPDMLPEDTPVEVAL
jgi:glycosyltransferase involved in cell wall biosynthesis